MLQGAVFFLQGIYKMLLTQIHYVHKLVQTGACRPALLVPAGCPQQCTLSITLTVNTRAVQMKGLKNSFYPPPTG